MNIYTSAPIMQVVNLHNLSSQVGTYFRTSTQRLLLNGILASWGSFTPACAKLAVSRRFIKPLQLDLYVFDLQ